MKKNFFIIGIVLLMVILGFVGYLASQGSKQKKISPTTPAKQVNWTLYQDSHGFSVLMPASFKTKINDWGLIMIGQDPENKKGPTAFATTMIFDQPQSNEKILEAVLPDLKKTFPDLEIIKKRNLEKYQALVCQIKYSSSEYAGAMLVVSKDKNAFVSGLLDKKEDFKNSRPILLKILSSFKYDKALQNPTKIAGLIEMTPWKDPNEGAFTIDVPKGWEAEGGLVRPYIDAGIKIAVKKEDKGIQIENPYPPIYVTPNWALEMGGFKEGSHYNPSGGLAQDMIVMKEKTAKEYLQTILPNKLKLSLSKIEARPDLVSKVPKMPWTTQTTAAEGRLTGEGKVHKVIVIEQGMKMAETGLWAVILVHYWAKEDEIGLVEEILERMERSFHLDETWAKREQKEMAKRVGIINQTGSEIADLISATFQYQSAVQDRAMRQWSNAMLGVERVYNPETGQEYEVPSGAEHYWSDGYHIVGTKVSEPPTYLDDWTELLTVE